MFESLGNLFNASSYANMGAGSMLAGAILVSSPIIIHLINRMRFKRIRWAAMEFLLKAQKRMRRKMIIEQLILLLLRILMVLLVGLLIARFMGFDTDGNEARKTAHVVLLDDSPSMGDQVKADNGSLTTAYESGKLLISEQIAPAAAAATTPQFLEVLLASRIEQPIPFNRLGSASPAEIKDKLALQELSTVRVPLAEAIRKAADHLSKTYDGTDTARVLHVISDFRNPDWSQESQAVREVVKSITDARITLNFIDVASPLRKDEKRSPRGNDNIAIIDLQPAKPIAAQHEQVEFTLKVQNFGTAEVSNKRFAVKVNGDESKVPGRVISTILPGQVYTEKFMVPFERLGSAEKPFQRFSIVTVGLAEEEDGGLQSDNVRHAVVEVRERLPILVVDGDPDLREKREGNSLYLQRYFQGASDGYQWVAGTPIDLEKDLSRFAFVLLLNVPGLNEKARDSLEAYLKEGGGAAFFLGPNVKPSEYNSLLYRDGAGCFPVPLPDSPSKELTDDELQEKRFSIQKKILVREPSARQHPALAALYTDERGQVIKDLNELEFFFRRVVIKRYWPVKRPGKWSDDPTVKELYCMPNEEPIKNFEGPAVEFSALITIPEPDPNKEKDPLPEILKELKSSIPATARSANPLWVLTLQLDRLLADQDTVGEPSEQALREYWAKPENAETRAKFARLRDAVKFGDPFYIAKEFGKGRVAVFTTTSSDAWNNWASEQPGNTTFPPIMKVMATYLSSGAIDRGTYCGTPIAPQLPAEQFKPEYRFAFMTHLHDPKAQFVPGQDPAPISEPKNELMVPREITEKKDDKEVISNYLVPTIADTRNPGVYMMELKRLLPGANPQDAPVETTVYQASVVNIDAEREGNLQRAATDDVKETTGGLPLNSPDDRSWIEQLKRKKSDISELGYVFALLLLILVLEQAMSVRMSYHSSADQLATTAPTIAAMQQRGTATPVA